MAFDKWLVIPRPAPRARVRLLVFPYAGASASVFSWWPDMLPSDVEVAAVQLPGRQTRLAEPPFTRLPPLVHTLAEALREYIRPPFALFGHSMGALIGFELARELRRRGVANPTHLFVSACRAPQLPDPDPPIHALPRAELLREIQKLNGTPPELLENSELMDLVLPTLRADAELTETYVHETGVPFAWPITAFGGIRDPKLTENDLSAWSRHTSERFTLHMFEGDHFFIHTAPQGMLKAIGDSLARPAVP